MGKAKALPTAEEYSAAIRQYCLQCSGGSRKEVERCCIRNCPLYPFRSNSALGIKRPPKQCRGQVTISSLLKQAE